MIMGAEGLHMIKGGEIQNMEQRSPKIKWTRTLVSKNRLTPKKQGLEMIKGTFFINVHQMCLENHQLLSE